MLLGSYRHAVDGKGRVAVPATLRRELPRGSVIAAGPEGRLVIHPPAEWQQQVDRYSLTPASPADERRYARNLFSSAREIEFDGQGRILLDAQHRSWAGVGDRAVFVGLGSVIEVVGEERWEAENAEVNPEVFTQLHDRVNTRPAAQA